MKLTGIAIAASVLTAGLFGLAQPAHAAAGDSVECYNGNYSGYKIECIADVTGSQITWTFNGSHLAAYDGKTIMFANCGTYGSPYHVTVNYIDSTTGAPAEVDTYNTCGTPNP